MTAVGQSLPSRSGNANEINDGAPRRSQKVR